MKPPPFKYFAPKTLSEAQGLVAQHGEDAKLLAGGQSLIPAMNYRVVQPAVLIDINGIDELRYVRTNGNGGLAIGAMTLQRELEFNPEVKARARLLHECVPYIAHPQIRNRGTLGGSLAHADPAAELPVVSVASEARMKALGNEGERWIEARDFFEGMFMTTLKADEMLVEVVFPEPPANSGWSFKEASRRRGDYAMMGVAVELGVDAVGVCQIARLVYLNAGDGPVAATQAASMLLKESPTAELFRAVATKAAQEEIDPIGNIHASVPYQQHLARVLTERALGEAFDRAAERADAQDPTAQDR